jgi:hypothetical protein
MKINDNTFTTSAGLPPGISFNNTAITIQNPISRFINQEVSVFGNTITDYRIGIHAINIPSPGIGFDIGTNTIAANEIIYNINNFPLTEYHGGIWLQIVRRLVFLTTLLAILTLIGMIISEELIFGVQFLLM